MVVVRRINWEAAPQFRPLTKTERGRVLEQVFVFSLDAVGLQNSYTWRKSDDDLPDFSVRHQSRVLEVELKNWGKWVLISHIGTARLQQILNKFDAPVLGSCEKYTIISYAKLRDQANAEKVLADHGITLVPMNSEIDTSKPFLNDMKEAAKFLKKWIVRTLY